MNVNERVERLGSLDVTVDNLQRALEDACIEAVRLAALAHYSDDPGEPLRNLRDHVGDIRDLADTLESCIGERRTLSDEQRAWERTARERQ